MKVMEEIEQYENGLKRNIAAIDTALISMLAVTLFVNALCSGCAYV